MPRRKDGDKLTIFYFINTRVPGERANSNQVMGTCSGLAGLGHKVILFTRRIKLPYRGISDPFEYYNVRNRFEIVRVPVLDWKAEDIGGRGRLRALFFYWSFVFFSIIYAIWRTVTKERPDIIYIRGLSLAFCFLLTRPIIGTTVIFETQEFMALSSRSGESDIIHGRRKSKGQVSRIERVEGFVFDKADGIVVGTDVLRETLSSLGYDESKICVAVDGFDPSRFEVAQSKSEVRKQLKLPTRETLVTYTGHLFPWKGTYCLVKAIKKVASKTKRAKLVLVGGIEWEPDIHRLKDLAKQLGINSQVIFTGYVLPSEVPKYLRAADILVIPTLESVLGRYAMPTKIFEYLAMEKPIIATRIPPHEQILKDKETAILVDPDDEQMLADAVWLLNEDKSLAKRIGKNAGELAKKFTWEERAKQLQIFFFSIPKTRTGEGSL